MADPVTAALAVSTVVSTGGQLFAGNAQRKAAEYEANQLDQNAKARFASATRDVAEQDRLTKKAMSDARAAMASSGGVTDDSGAIDTLGKIGQRGKYNAMAALYEGERDMEGLRAAARGRRFEGKMDQRASRIRALSTAISGGIETHGSYSQSR